MDYTDVKSRIKDLESESSAFARSISGCVNRTDNGYQTVKISYDGDRSHKLDLVVIKKVLEDAKAKVDTKLAELQELDATMDKVFGGLSK